MTEAMELVLRAIPIGIGATAVLDGWSLLLARLFGVPASNWGIVGRWIAHLPSGRLVQENLAAAPGIPGEAAIGWVAHYLVGIVFATSLLLITGPEWLRHPTVLPAVAFGAVTVIFPYFVLQPGLGLGIAASRAPDPTRARLRSLGAHIVFGIGLYLSALVLAAWSA